METVTRDSLTNGAGRPGWARATPSTRMSPDTTARVSLSSPRSTTTSRATPSVPPSSDAGSPGGKY